MKPNVRTSKLQSKISFEELGSPAIHDRHLKRLSKPDHGNSDTMKQSAKHYTFESAKVVENESKVVEKEDPSESMYKVKMVLFLLVSFLMMYWAMTPTRKCPYKKNRR